MKYFKLITPIIIFFLINGCSSQNLDKEFNCDGIIVKYNDYERFFEVKDLDLSNNKDFFMNQITIFSKFKNNFENESLVTFNKINKTLEIRGSNAISKYECNELN